LAASDSQRAKNELADYGAKWNVSVIDVNRRLGLVYTATAHPGKYLYD
jgi:hypothetical protein